MKFKPTPIIPWWYPLLMMYWRWQLKRIQLVTPDEYRRMHE